LSEVVIRRCTTDDLEQLNDVYNHYIRTSPATFDLEEITIEDRRERFRHYAETGRYQVFVACEGDPVLGFASSSQFRPKRAYDPSVETSVYIGPDACGRGIGSLLYEALFTALEGEDIHRAYAGITLPNDASLALHQKFGFEERGRFTEQGRKFDKYWDVLWLEKEM
jgi:phosphinothricin acetyltransferase